MQSSTRTVLQSLVGATNACGRPAETESVLCCDSAVQTEIRRTVKLRAVLKRALAGRYPNIKKIDSRPKNDGARLFFWCCTTRSSPFFFHSCQKFLKSTHGWRKTLVFISVAIIDATTGPINSRLYMFPTTRRYINTNISLILWTRDKLFKLYYYNISSKNGFIF